MERWVLDTGKPLVLPLTNRQGVVRVLEQSTPAPAERLSSAQRPEGSLITSREFEPRPVTLKLELERPTDQWWDVTHDFGAPPSEAEGEGEVPGWTGTVRRCSSDGSAILPAIEDLASAVGSVQTAPGSVAGTLTRVLEDGRRLIFDILSVSWPDGPDWTPGYYLRDSTTVTLVFSCLPFARGQELELGSLVRPAGQRLAVLDDLQVPGDVPALARLEYSGATVDQRTLFYGIDRPDDASLATGVQLAATTLDRPAATTTTTVSGSVASQVVTRPATAYDAGWARIVSLRQSGVPLPLSGTYRVWGRVRSAADQALRLRWTSGVREQGMTVNPSVSAGVGVFALLDLGLVTAGGQLDGVVECATPLAEAVSLDVLLLVPVEVSGVLLAAPAGDGGELVVRDTGGSPSPTPLVGSAAQYGGSWVSLGTGGSDAVWDREVSGAQRTGAAGTWRLAGVPIATAASMRARATLAAVAGTPFDGHWHTLLAVGNTAGLQALATGGVAAAGGWAVGVAATGRPGSTNLRLWTVTAGSAPASVTGPNGAAPTVSVDLVVQSGRVSATVSNAFGPAATMESPVASPPGSGLHVAVIAHGGSSGSTAWIGDLSVTAGDSPPDVALAASQSTVIATGGASRTTSAGLAGPVVPMGDRPVLPVSGRAGRPVRVVAGGLRGRLDAQIDEAPTDPLTLTVHGTPRFLQVP